MGKLKELEKEIQNLKKSLLNDKSIEYEDENLENSINNDKIESFERNEKIPNIPIKKHNYKNNNDNKKKNKKNKSAEKILMINQKRLKNQIKMILM